MSRADTRELYQNLINAELSFVPRGRHYITYIYDCVLSKYPNLCDDSYLFAVKIANQVLINQNGSILYEGH